MLHAIGPRVNFNITSDDSVLDPHVSRVKTSHPAAQLDVNSEQRTVRQSMMSGSHNKGIPGRLCLTPVERGRAATKRLSNPGISDSHFQDIARRAHPHLKVAVRSHDSLSAHLDCCSTKQAGLPFLVTAQRFAGAAARTRGGAPRALEPHTRPVAPISRLTRRLGHGCRRTFRSSELRTAGTPSSAPALAQLAERVIHIHLPPASAGSIRVLGCCRRSSSRLFPSIAGLTPLEGLNQFNE